MIDRSGYVYFITDGEAIKIGFSNSPQSRLVELQVSHYTELRLVLMVRGTRADEARLHAQFDHARIRGEWFERDPELTRYIEERRRPPRLSTISLSPEEIRDA